MKASLWATLVALLDGLVLAAVRRATGGGVLLVRLDAIGDFVVWSDAARVLAKHYSDRGVRVTLLANGAWAEWATDFGIADRVWSIDRRRFRKDLRYRWRWLARIRRAGFDIAIEPCRSRVFLVGDSVMKATGATERLGWAGDAVNTPPSLQRWSDRWFTRLVPASGQQMELRANAEFARAAGVRDCQARMPRIPDAAIRESCEPFPQPYAVLFPGASSPGRVWPAEKMAEVGRRLIDAGLHLVVAGGPDDRTRVEGLERLGLRFTNLAGRTTLSELAAVLRSSRVVVTNDTSAAHIGAGVDARVVCVLGGGQFGRFMPYDVEVRDPQRPLPVAVHMSMPCFGCDWVCIFPHRPDEAMKCVRDIGVDAVWEAVVGVLTHDSSESPAS